MKDLPELFLLIKKDFCELTKYKLRGNTIEIVTPITTLNQSHVSVFLSVQDNNYVVSDGGWIDTDEYEVDEFSKEELADLIDDYLIDYYQIRTINSASNIKYHYRISPDINLVSAMAYDVANFVSNYVNSRLMVMRHTVESKKRKPKFKTRINNFLKTKFSSNELSLNEKIMLDDNHQIRFNSVIRTRVRQSNTVVMMYVSGSQPDMFNDSIARATTNFEIVRKFSKKENFFDMIAIINMSSNGYRAKVSAPYLKNMIQVIGKEPIKVTEENDLTQLAEALPPSGDFLGLSNN
jgi:hypothetical protein